MWRVATMAAAHELLGMANDGSTWRWAKRRARRFFTWFGWGVGTSKEDEEERAIGQL